MFVTRKVWIKYQNAAGADDGSGAPSGGASDGSQGSGEGEGEPAKPGGEPTKPAVDDGQRKPSDEEARLLKENMKRKEELRKKDEELAALKKSVEGIDLEAVRKLLADQRAAEEKALEAKGDFDNLKKRMAEEHGKEVTTLKGALEAKDAEAAKLRSQINDMTLGSKFTGSQFISDELVYTPSKARVLYGEHFDLEDGKVVGYDKPRGAANRTALVDQYGEPVDFDSALRKIVEADPEKDYLLKSKVKAGAGSESKRTNGVQQKAQPDSAVDKIAAGLKGLKAI